MATEMTMSEIQGLTTAQLRNALTECNSEYNLGQNRLIRENRKIHEKRLYKLINGHEHGSPNQRRTRRQTLQAKTTISRLSALNVAGSSAQIHPKPSLTIQVSYRNPVLNQKQFSTRSPQSNQKLPLQDMTNKSKQPKHNKATKNVPVPQKKIKLTKLSSSFVLNILKSSETEKKITEKLKPKFVSENCITTNSLKISTSCPLSKRRMIQPARFKSCKHIDCLDFWPLIETSQIQGYNPRKTSIFNASDDDLDQLMSHPGKKVLRNYLRNPVNILKSNFKIKEELKNQPESIRNWISKVSYETRSGKKEKAANFMTCPICNNNLLGMADLEICEFTKQIIQETEGKREYETEIEFELENGQVQIKKRKKTSGGILKEGVKFMETDSGSLYSTRVEMNSRDIPVVCLD